MVREKLLAFVREQELLPAGSTVVCAVSGGPDSMALLSCLLSLRETLGIRVSAAHFNHCLRGEESDGDEALVRSFCRENGVPLSVGSADVAAERGTESVETAARRLRYAFLESLPGLIATAHTADDNAETVLMALVRGSGLRGLAGIPPKRGRIVRPMLSVTRAEVMEYLTEAGVPYRTDSTNGEDGCRRNRIRRHVIPLLKEENPGLAQTVLRQSRILREEETYLDAAAAEAVCRARDGDGWRCEPLIALPDALLRRALRQIAGMPLEAVHTDALLRLLRSGAPCGRTELPGGRILLMRSGRLRFAEAHIAIPEPPMPLPIPGTLRLPDVGLEITCRVYEEAPPPEPDAETILLCRDAVTEPITVRRRKTGDCLRRPGGSKEVRRLMTDRKIPTALRDSLPVFCMGSQLLAVSRLGADRAFLPIPGKPVLCIRIIQTKKDHIHTKGE